MIRGAWLGAGLLVAGVAVVGVSALGGRRRAKVVGRPSVVCPARPPADTSELAIGDYVAVTLRGPKTTSKKSERLRVTTWALVVGNQPNRRVLVRLVGEFGLAGVRMLPAELGYQLGDRITIARQCILEVYHPARSGVVLCGQWLVDATGKGAVAAANRVAGDEVLIFIAPADPNNPQLPGPGWDILDSVWARIESISRAGHVLSVRVLDDPSNTAGHGIVAGDTFDITRECIADARAGRS